MTEAEALEALGRWHENDSQRDDVVRSAREAGVSKYQIHQITGLARTTIDRILDGKEQQA
jgi:predicted transcriptional regulator